MPDLPGEVAGLPEGGPATLAAVRVRVGLAVDDNSEDAALEPIVEAVNDEVRCWQVAERSAAPETPVEERTWRRGTELGANMLCSRLYSRRNSPIGVEAYAAGGPVYVQRNDPDIGMLLKLGAWSAGVVG